MGKRFSKILKGQITSSVFYILFGLCLILMPVKTVDLICKVVFGLVLIGAGCYHVYIYVREKESSTILDLFSGVIVLVLGGFLFYNPQVVVKLLPLLLGAFVLVDSIWTLQGCLKLKKHDRQEWKALLLGSLIFIGLGIAMVINPFPGVKYTVIFAGWVFLLNGVVDLVFLFLLHKTTKALESGAAGEAASENTGADTDTGVKDEEEKTKPDAGHEEWKDSWTAQNHLEEEDDGPVWKKFFGRNKKAEKALDSVDENSEASETDEAAVDGSWESVEDEEPKNTKAGKEATGNDPGSIDDLYKEGAAQAKAAAPIEPAAPIDPAAPIEPAAAIEKAPPIERAPEIERAIDTRDESAEGQEPDLKQEPEEPLEEWKD